MKKRLIIIGAGSVGGFVAYNHEHLKSEYELIGFLDDDITKLDKKLFNYPVLGTTNDIKKYIDCFFILGIAFPKIKDKIVTKLSKYNLRYINYISPSAWISNGVTIGNGVIIYPGVCIDYEVTLEDFVTINMNAVIGHNCLIDQYSTLAPGVCLAGHTSCLKGSDLGINSATRQNVVVGEYAVLGGNAIALNDINKNTVSVGVPAKEIIR